MKKFKITVNSPVTLGFIFISFAVLLLNFITVGKSNMFLFMTYHSSLASPFTYIRMLTHVLGHSGWEHFIGNATYLLLLGPMLEEKYGSPKLVMVIIITAIVTGLVNFIIFP
ncbi:MAG: rhomboid family intramembrane serine protease, partial [Firmicutes bacterium]|nr:rhomboid family intramembrane serine protease [Bacillota bacterium]